VHVAAWVDDLIFIMKTPEHGECAGFEGGCPVCQEYHDRALDVQRLWQDKARRLNIPLSEKGHVVGQAGAVSRWRSVVRPERVAGHWLIRPASGAARAAVGAAGASLQVLDSDTGLPPRLGRPAP